MQPSPDVSNQRANPYAQRAKALHRALLELTGRISRQPTVSIRPIRADDRERLVQAFAALDPRAVYQRLFCAKRELSEADLRAVTHCDGVRNVVLVATVQGAGDSATEQIVGVGQYAGRGPGVHVAFAVVPQFQGRGIATRLLRRLLRIARRNGAERFEADVLAENLPMLAVLRHAGLPVRSRDDGSVLHLSLDLTAATAADAGRRSSHDSVGPAATGTPAPVTSTEARPLPDPSALRIE